METFEFMNVHLFMPNTAEKPMGGDRRLSFTTDHSSDQVANIINGSVENGWRILSVHIYTDYNSRGEFINVKDPEVISAVFGALAEDPENAGVIISFGELFGWHDPDPFTHTRYGRSYIDGFQGYYESETDFAQNICEELDILPVGIPDWIVIDWESTGENLMDDFLSHDYNETLYFFANH